MRFLRRAALFLVAALVVYACTEQKLSVVDVVHPTSLAIAPRFVVLGSFQSDPIARIILTARSVATNQIVAVDTFTVQDDNSWSLPFQVPADVGSVTVLVELLNSSNVVQFSGITPPIQVNPGTSNAPADVPLVPGPPDNLTVNSVSVSPRNLSATEGDIVQLSAAITGGGPNAHAAWGSSDTNIATVDQNGRVITLRNGTVRIMAQAGMRIDTATIAVAQRVASITLSPDTQRISSVGTEVVFTAQVVDPRGSAIAGQGVVWSVGNAAIAQSLGNGRFRAAGNGSTQITAASATAPSILRNGTIVVSQRAGRVNVSPALATLTSVGARQTFTADVQDANGNPITAPVVWRSSNSTIATIDATGSATAVSSGTVDITAVAGAGTPDSAVGRASLQITQAVRSVTVTPAGSTLDAIGDTVRFTAVARDANNNVVPNIQFAWSSTSTSTATIDNNGLARAAGNGATQIFADVGGIRAGVILTVAQRITRVTVTPPTSRLTSLGQTLQLAASAFDRLNQPVVGQRVLWSSSNPASATVDTTGRVTAVANGVAGIRAAIGDTAGIATITVQQSSSSAIIVPAVDTVAVGDSARFVATARDGNNAPIGGVVFTYSVSDTSIASIDATGLARGKRIGTVTITATGGGVTAQATLLVQQTGPATLLISPRNAFINAIGDTLPLTAQVRDAVGGLLAGAPVNWVSRNPAAITVNASGQAISVTTGTSWLVATSGVAIDSVLLTSRQIARTVVLTPPAHTLLLGDSILLALAASDSNNVAIPAPLVNAFSTAPGIAGVNPANLKVVGNTVGNANIVASVNGVADTTAITVTAPNLVITQITVTPNIAPDTLVEGDSLTISVKLKNIGTARADSSMTRIFAIHAGTNNPIGGASFDVPTPPLNAGDSIVAFGRVTVDTLIFWPDSLRVQALADIGFRVRESAENDNGNVSAKRYVKFRVARVQLTPNNVFMRSLGDTAIVTASPRDRFNRPLVGRPVTWTSLMPDTVTVDSLGRVVSVGNGFAKVLVSSGGRGDTLYVNVFQFPFTTHINGPANDTVVFNSLQDTIPVTVTMRDARNNLVTRFRPPLFSLDPAIAHVDTLGRIISHQVGTARIVSQIFVPNGPPPDTTTHPVADTLIAIVRQVPASVNIGPDSLTVFMGDTLRLFPNVEDAHHFPIPNPALTWRSSDTTVVQVDNAGKITARLTVNGAAYVYATLGTLTDSVRIRVVGPLGVTKVWLGNSNAWSNAANWSPAGVPTAADTVLLRAAAAFAPVLTGNQSVGGVQGEPGVSIDVGAHTLNVGGHFLLLANVLGTGTVEFSGANKFVRAGNLPNVVVSGQVVLDTVLTINGAFVISGRADINRAVTVTGNFSTINDAGRLGMMNPAASLMVNGNALFDGGAVSGLLSAGTMTVKGSLLQQQPCGYGNSDDFNSFGTFTLVLAGAAPQPVSFNCASASHIQSLTVNNAAGVTFNTDFVVNGVVSIVTGGIAAGNGGIAAGVGGLIDPGLRWQIPSTSFVPGVTQLPDSIQSYVRFNGFTSLPHNLKIIGDLDIRGGSELVVGPNQLKVTGNFGTRDDGGLLTMTHPASFVDVTGNVLFDGGSHNGRLTAGVLRIGGNFSQQQPCGYGNSDEFFANGTHTTVFAGVAQSILSNCHTSSRFNNVQIGNTSTATIVTAVTMGGTLTVNGVITGAQTLTVAGDVSAPAGSTISTAGLSAGAAVNAASAVYNVNTTTFTGPAQVISAALNYNAVVVNGSASLSGPTVFNGNLSIPGTLDIAGNSLTVVGHFSTNNDAGRLVMQNAAGSVVVNGNTTFDGGSETGLLSAGTLTVKGNFLQQQPCGYGNSDEFGTTGTFKLVLNGATAQNVQFNCANSSRIQNLDVNNAAGVTFINDFIVSDIARTIAGQVTTDNPGRTGHIGGGLLDAELRWRVPNTTFFNVPSVFPDSMQSYVTFTGSVTLPHSFKVLGNFDIRNGANVIVGPNTLTVAGNFRTMDDNAHLTMTDPASVVAVTGDVTFDGGSHPGRLTAGTLRVGGNFVQQQPCGYGNSDEFAASGTHTTVFTGTAQTLRTNCPTSSHFQNLQIDNSSTVTLVTDAVANGASTVNGTLTGGFNFTAANGVTAPAGSTLSTSGLATAGAISAASATYTVGTTTFYGTGQTVSPALNYGGVVIGNGATVSLTGPTTFNGNLAIDGQLAIVANALTVTGAFATINDRGRLVMQNAGGSVIVNGNTTFDGGSETGLLSAGTLTVKGNFLQQQPCGYGNSDEFGTTGTFKLVLNGATAQNAQFNCANSSRIQNLDVNNAAGVTFINDFIVSDIARTIAGQVTTDNPGRTGHIGGGLIDSELRWRVPNTTFFNVPSVFPDSMQSYVTFTGNVTLPHSFKVLGSFDIRNGANVIVGPNTLAVTGNFRTMDDNAFLTMTDPASIVDVDGNVTFDGGSHTNRLTAGTLRIGGNFLQQQPCGYGNSDEFFASGAHSTVFKGAAQTITSNCRTASRFHNLHVQNGTTVTLLTDATAGGALTVNGVLNGAFTLFVAGNVNGGLGSSFGLSGLDVAGTMSTESSIYNVPLTTFSAANQTIQGTYKGALINGAATLSGATVFAGNLRVAGSLDVGANALAVSGNFSTINDTGRLIMGDDASAVVVTGSATFDGASATQLTKGTLTVTGNFLQQQPCGYGNSNDFAPSGTHTTVLAATAAQTVQFNCNSSSFFRNLVMSGAGPITLQSDVVVTGGISAGAVTVTGSNRLLSVQGGSDVVGTTFDNVRFSGLGSGEAFNDVTFTNMSSSVAQLTLAIGTTFTSSGLTFSTPPTSGSYITVTGGGTLNLINTTPSYHGGQIVGTITGWSLAPDGITHLWKGTSSNWNSAGNWLPAVVPGATDTVLIRTGFTSPTVSSNSSVGGIYSETGAQVAVAGGVTFTIGGAVDEGTEIGGAGTVVLGGGRVVSGRFPNVAMNGNNISLGGTLTTTGNFQANGGTLYLNGKRLAVGGDFSATNSNNLNMTHPADTLEIGGTALFDGADPGGHLSNGTVIVKGNFMQQCTSHQQSYQTSSNHTTIFKGTSPQTITFGNCAGNSYFNNVEFANTGTVFASDVIVLANTIVTSGNVTNTVGDAYLHGSLNDAVGDRWQVSTTHFRGGGLVVIGRIKGNVIFDANGGMNTDISVLGNVTVSNSGNSFVLNGHTLQVTGNFVSNNQSYINMTNAADVIDVSGNVTIDGNDLTGRLTNGVLKVQGNFTQACTSHQQSYHASGNHKTLFNGSGAQTVTFGNCAGNSFFHDVEFANGGTVFAAPVIVIRDTKLTSGNVTGSVDAYLRRNFHDAVGDRWQVATTHIQGSSPIITGRINSALVLFDANTTLASDVAIQGNTTVSNGSQSLVLNGHKLEVAGDFAVVNQSYLNMQNAADILDVSGNVSFDGNDLTGRLSNGLVKLKGNFTQSCTSHQQSYRASGAHKTLLYGTGSQTVTFGNCAGNSYFNDVEFNNGGTVLASDVIVIGTAKVSGGNVTNSAGDAYLYGPFQDAVGDRWQVGMTHLRATSPSVVGRIKGNVLFDANSVLATNVSVFGNVTISNSGQSLDLNGHTLQVTGNFISNNQSYFNMQNAADVLDVGGNVTFDGNDLTGRLTNGVLKLKGNFAQSCTSHQQSYRPSGSHTTLFYGTGSQSVSFGNCAGNSWFHNVDFNNVGTVFASDVIVKGTATVSGGNVTNSAGEAYLFGPFVDAVGDRWQVGSTHLRAPSVSATGRIKSNVTFDVSQALGTDVAVFGNVTVSNGGQSFDMNSHTLSVTGNFSSINQSYFVMTHAGDLLDVSGDVTFDGNDETGRLSDGIIRVAGNFTQICTSHQQSFAASINHRTVFNNTSEKQVNFGNCAGNSFFRDVDITNGGGISIVGNTMHVKNNLNVAAGTHIAINSGKILDVWNNLVNAGTISVSGVLIANLARVTNTGTISPSGLASITPGH